MRVPKTVNTPPDNDTHEVSPPDHSTVVFMLSAIADTTWRMFVPTISLMSGGYFADQALGTKPWLFYIGVVVGAIIAGLLVRKQLRKTL